MLAFLQVRVGLGPIDPYFVKVADGMLAWCECWAKINPQHAS
jgi:reversibly glycosylated polypeptide/UDP-arabinopyranose mutase